jgi:predicted Zn-dependent protease
LIIRASAVLVLAAAPYAPLAARAANADPAPAPSAAPALTDSQRKEAEAEVRQGEQISTDLTKAGKILKDDPRVKRVTDIGHKIADIVNNTSIEALYGQNWTYPYTWHFAVINDPDINAFSTPGGFVYINTGLLDKVRSDDELAGILGHEMTHVAHHHVAAIAKEANKMNMQMLAALLVAMLARANGSDTANVVNAAGLLQQGLLNTKYSQRAERDADHGGCILIQKAGYLPAGMLTFMELLRDQERRSPSFEPGIFRDHPLTDDRITSIRAQLTAMGVPLTRAALASASGAPRATVNLPTPETSEILLGKQSIALLSDPKGERANTAAAALNKALDQGLALYQVRAQNGTLVVANVTVLTFTPADAGLSHGETSDGLATIASRALRRVLYMQGIGSAGVY